MGKVKSKSRNDNKTIGIYLDMIVEKFYRVTEVIGWDYEGLIERTNGLIKIMIPIPSELQGKSGYAVYRYHGDTVNIINQVPNADGEYLVFNQSDWTITLYAKNFSVYAIAYDSPVSVSDEGEMTITFNSNEGSTSLTTYSLNRGELLTEPIEPTRAGYIFGGWAKEDGTLWNFSTDKVYSDINLTAKWILELDKENHFAYMQGYPDKTFRQERSMTRAEVTVMFARLLVEKMNMDTRYPSSFKDVDASKWYADAIGYMEKFGVITGYSDGTFRPDATITRAEFATIAARFDKLIVGEPIVFTDVKENHWARDYISFANTKGWIKGYPDGTFKPNNNITRAEVVSLVNRMLERTSDKGFVNLNKDNLNQYTDLQGQYWAYYDIMEATNGHDYEKSSDSETWLKQK